MLKKICAVLLSCAAVLAVVSGCAKDNDNATGVNASADSTVSADSIGTKTQADTSVSENNEDISAEETSKNSSAEPEPETDENASSSKSEKTTDNDVSAAKNPSVEPSSTKTNEETKAVNALEAKDTFTVTFKDYDGTVLKTETVEKGKSAVAPELPERDGYIFAKWDTDYENVRVDIVVTAVYKKITEPTLIVKNVQGKPGDKVSVAVSVMNNPGLLGLMLNVVYDDSVLKLTKVESGSAMDGYTFTSPKNLKSGCNALWNINDVPSKLSDGEVMILHFEIPKKAKSGTYTIHLSSYDGAFDEEYNPVAFDIIDGAVIIK
ncbi:MAG: cohesin domain-containing protein [Acutalibacteraceae bacterium]